MGNRSEPSTSMAHIRYFVYNATLFVLCECYRCCASLLSLTEGKRTARRTRDGAGSVTNDRSYSSCAELCDRERREARHVPVAMLIALLAMLPTERHRSNEARWSGLSRKARSMCCSSRAFHDDRSRPRIEGLLHSALVQAIPVLRIQLEQTSGGADVTVLL